MKRGLVNRSLLLILLLASVFGMVFASATSSINLPFIMASTEGGEGGDGSEDSGGSEEGRGDDSEPEPEPEPGPEPDPQPEPPIDTVAPVVPDPKAAVLPELPPCDGSAQDCITPGGDICLVGQGGHECECAEDFSDCPLHPSKPPLESPSPREILPYCDIVNKDPNWEGACHDRYDYDEQTGLYPCNDGTYEEAALDCPDAYVPPCNPETDENCDNVSCPAVVGTDCIPGPKCKEGYELVDGKCVPKEEEPKCPPGWEYREKQDDCHKEITIIINKIIKETNEGKHKDGFPEVDIIGLSVKQDGDSMICAMDIDSDHIECQEFGMDPQKVNQAFWRVIETDSSKNYDNGNTGSNNVDLAIQDIKNHDFDELDDDRDNHNFGIDLAWVAINPQGEGVTCLTTDQNGKGKSLCEPFKVSAQDVSGQITEGVEFS